MSSEPKARTLQEIKALGTVTPIYNPGIILSADLRPYPAHSFYKLKSQLFFQLEFH